MKTLIKILIPLQIAVIALSPVTSLGEDYSKTIKNKYNVNDNAQLVIQNKFGEVRCLNWTEKAVSIEVTITVDASSQEKAQKLLDKISVSMSGSSDKVEAITDIAETGFNNVEFSIDYIVMMPENVRLDLMNKFGDSYVEEVSGQSRLEIQYGNMEIKSLKHSSNNIIVKFSDALHHVGTRFFRLFF